MDLVTIKAELRAEFPDKEILHAAHDPQEVIVEIEADAQHSIAIAIIDQTPKHFHRETTEVYQVEQGTLCLIVDETEHVLHEGDSFTIQPGQVHISHGNATRVRVTCTPPWSPNDHILV